MVSTIHQQGYCELKIETGKVLEEYKEDEGEQSTARLCSQL